MNFLLTGAFSYDNEQLSAFKKLGINFDFIQYEKDEIKSPEIYNGVICNGLFLYHKIEDFKKLKYIQLTSAGYDRVPMEYVKANGIKIFNAGNTYAIPMAEWALLKTLEIYKNSKFFIKNQDEKKWDKLRNIRELSGKTVLIAGAGNVGREVAKRFKGFDTTVIAADIVKNDCPFIDEWCHINNIKDVLSKSDVVVLTLPLLDSTRGMFDREMFSLFKNGAVLINISRGPIVDTNALCDALDKNLSAAALDVFEEEPLNENSELWGKENVIITPHNSFVSENNNKRLFNIILKNLKTESEF